MQGRREADRPEDLHYPQSEYSRRRGAPRPGTTGWRSSQRDTTMANGKKEAPKISIDISPGEAIDRFAILNIKVRNVTSVKQRRQLAEEGLKLGALIRDLPESDLLDVGVLAQMLENIHETLWHVENDIRACEAVTSFDSQFISLARQVYQLNDARSELKRRIDEAYGHPPEVKEYTSYGQEEKEDSGPASSGCPHSGG